MDDRRQALILGREHYERHEYDRAEHFLKLVLEEHDGYADVHNMLGVIHHGRGDFLGAARCFERAVALNGGYTEALLNLAISYNDVGKYREGREVFARIRKARASGELAGDAYALGKIANLHAGVAQAYADAGYLGQAAVELEKAVALRPEFTDLRVKLASTYRDQGKFADAERELLAACAEKPSYARARILLGVTLLSLGRRDDAAARFHEALAIDPDDKGAKMYLRFAERPPPLAPDLLDDEAWAAPDDDGNLVP